MKPFTKKLYSPTAIRYNVGISGPYNMIDQKRNPIRVRPGLHLMIQVLPKVFETTKDFDRLRQDQRGCKLSTESEGLSMINNYTRIGCETECALKKAMSICQCIPWYLPNDFNTWPMCEMFGHFCFDIIMDDDDSYRHCKHRCKPDCKETEHVVVYEYFPLDIEKMCSENEFHGLAFNHHFQRHFAFHNYKLLVENGTVPDDQTVQSICPEYIRKYVALLTVESPTKEAILTHRDKALFFFDKFAIIYGTYGLFVGMSFMTFWEVVFLLLSIIYEIPMYFIRSFGIGKDRLKPDDQKKRQEDQDDEEVEILLETVDVSLKIFTVILYSYSGELC